MPKRLLREVLNETHTCKWQTLKENEDGTITLVCEHPECGKTKIVQKPKLQENTGGKRVLYG